MVTYNHTHTPETNQTDPLLCVCVCVCVCPKESVPCLLAVTVPQQPVHTHTQTHVCNYKLVKTLIARTHSTDLQTNTNMDPKTIKSLLKTVRTGRTIFALQKCPRKDRTTLTRSFIPSFLSNYTFCLQFASPADLWPAEVYMLLCTDVLLAALNRRLIKIKRRFSLTEQNVDFLIGSHWDTPTPKKLVMVRLLLQHVGW